MPKSAAQVVLVVSLLANVFSLDAADAQAAPSATFAVCAVATAQCSNANPNFQIGTGRTESFAIVLFVTGAPVSSIGVDVEVRNSSVGNLAAVADPGHPLFSTAAQWNSATEFAVTGAGSAGAAAATYRVELASFELTGGASVDTVYIPLSNPSVLDDQDQSLPVSVADASVSVEWAYALDLLQCQQDVSDSLSLLASAQSAYLQCLGQRRSAEADGDGEDDGSDACLDTPSGQPVDRAGCSQAQFCAARALTCKRNDWRNDEGGVRNPGDCAVLDGSCVPR